MTRPGGPEATESMQQLASVWRMTALDRTPDADVRDLPGIALRWADCPFAFWNAVTFTDPIEDRADLRARLERVVEIMREKAHPGFLWTFDDLLAPELRPELEPAARAAGLVLAFPGLGMAAPDLSGVADPQHPDLTFERVTTPEHLRDYADLNAAGYGMASADVRDGLVGSRLWTDDVHAYLGYRDGTAVCCAGTIAADGRLFVILVATHPDAQRRGYGEAVTRKAIYEGHRATGLSRGTLHATVAGTPVYPRIGFRPNSSIGFYSLADPWGPGNR